MGRHNPLGYIYIIIRPLLWSLLLSYSHTAVVNIPQLIDHHYTIAIMNCQVPNRYMCIIIIYTSMTTIAVNYAHAAIIVSSYLKSSLLSSVLLHHILCYDL